MLYGSLFVAVNKLRPGPATTGPVALMSPTTSTPVGSMEKTIGAVFPLLTAKSIFTGVFAASGAPVATTRWNPAAVGVPPEFLVW
jgi:hypothetical protein